MPLCCSSLAPPNTKSFHLQVWRQFVCEDELEKVYKSHTHWMLYVPSQKGPPQNGHKWELKDGRKEWVGEVGEASSLATQWQGDVPGAALLYGGFSFFFFLCVPSVVHCCGEKLQRGRVWMVEWKCRLVTAKHSIVVLLGTVGKCQADWGESRDVAIRPSFVYWFSISAIIFSIYQTIRVSFN